MIVSSYPGEFSTAEAKTLDGFVILTVEEARRVKGEWMVAWWLKHPEESLIEPKGGENAAQFEARLRAGLVG
mgnify:FL=1